MSSLHNWQADRWDNLPKALCRVFGLLCGQRLSCALHSFWRKRWLTVHFHHRKGSQSVNSSGRSNSSQQKGTLLADDSCSGISSAPPLTFLPALAIDHNTLLGAREKVHASFPLNPLTLFSSVPDFWYPSLWEIFCWWISRSICYQRVAPSLAPCHTYQIKNIMDTWLWVWLDFFSMMET